MKTVAVSDSVNNGVSEIFYELIQITISLLSSVAIHDRDLQVKYIVYALLWCNSECHFLFTI